MPHFSGTRSRNPLSREANPHHSPQPTMSLNTSDQSEPNPPPSPDWSHLPADLLSAIFSLLPSNTDCINFRSVCPSWRSASPRRLPFPLLLYPLPCRLDEDGHNFCSFFDLVASRQGTVDLPELRSKQLCGSTAGFLVLRGNGSRPPFPVSVFNPFTRSLFPLPPLSDPPEKIVLTSLPPSPITAVALMGWGVPLLFYAQSQPSWAPLQTSSSFHDAVPLNGALYAVDAQRRIFIYDPIRPDSVPVQIPVLTNRPVRKGKHKEEKNYLVESFGDLFLVIRSFRCSHKRLSPVTLVTTKLDVFKVELDGKPKWSVARGFGDGVLFLGVNTSFSLSASNLSRFEPFSDQLFFTDDGFNHLGEIAGREEDMGFLYLDGAILCHSMCRAEIPSPVLPPAIFFLPSI